MKAVARDERITETPSLPIEAAPPRASPRSAHWSSLRLAGRRLAASVHLDLAVSVALIACSLALTLPRLGVPSRAFFDEILYAYTAREYLRGTPEAHRWDDPCAVGQSDDGCLAHNPAAQLGERVGKIEWTHPPLSKELIAGGIWLLGDTPAGRRLPGVLAGAVGVALLYRLGLALTRRRAIGLLAAGLLLLDGLWFVESRLALPDVFLAVATLGATLAFTGYLTAPVASRSWPLFLTGALLGLAFATKWSAAFVWGLIGLVVAFRLWQLGRPHWQPGGIRRVLRSLGPHLARTGLSLFCVPLSMYLLTHLPFFAAGNGLADFVELHWRRFAYHRDYAAQFEYASYWWQWPLALRPAWYGATTSAGDHVANIYANGNPLLFWGMLPATIWVGWRWWRDRRLGPLVLVLAIGFFGQWLPWALVSRSTFVYHFLPAVPFGCLAVAVAISDCYRSGEGWRRTLAVEYVVLVALAFLFFYPLYAFVPLDPHNLELRLWLPTWQ